MEQTKQQTALDLFIAALKEWKVEGSLTDYEFKIPAHIFTHMEKRTRQMDEEQIKKTWFDSTLQFDNAAEMTYKKDFEQYYNETYNAQ